MSSTTTITSMSVVTFLESVSWEAWTHEQTSLVGVQLGHSAFELVSTGTGSAPEFVSTDTGTALELMSTDTGSAWSW